MTGEMTKASDNNDELISDVDVAPEEIVDAGPDPRPPHRVRNGLDIRRVARRKFGSACLSLINDREKARQEIREAIRTMASATYWLEDTEYFDVAHDDLHTFGRFAREHFPEDCEVHWDGKAYSHTCPVPIAHKRFGFSPEMIVKRHVCSLCGDDASECPHLPLQLYRVRGGCDYSPSGRCRVCIKEECEHDPNTTYLVTQVRIVEKIERMDGVAIVGRPVQPDARLTAVPIETKDLADYLGPGFTPGMRLQCSQCLERCGGFTRPFEQSGEGEGEPAS
jgi:hypothetical protein